MSSPPILSTPTVTLTGPASLVEGGRPGVYLVGIDQAQSTPVSVYLQYQGNALDSTDYRAVRSVVIPAGQTSVSFEIATLDDAYAEIDKSFTISIGSASTGSVPATALQVSETQSAVETRIVDDVGPTSQDPALAASAEDTVYVALGGPAQVNEGAVAKDYTVTLDKVPASDVVVRFKYAGTALDGSDFTGVSEVVVKAGERVAHFDLSILADQKIEGAETLVVSLASIDGGGFEAVEVAPGAGEVSTRIIDMSTPAPVAAVLSLTGPGAVVEGQIASGYQVSLDKAPTSDVIVRFSYTGVARNGVDFKGVASVTIPAGKTRASFDVSTLDDLRVEAKESFTVSVASMSGGGFTSLSKNPAASSVVTTITDNDVAPAPVTAQIGLSGVTQVTEGGVAKAYTVTLDKVASADVTVVLSYSGTALKGSDYTGQTSIVIPKGQKSASFDIATIDDSVREATESFRVSLVRASGGGFSKLTVDPMAAGVTTRILDNDVAPEAKISLNGVSEVVEGQVAKAYTVTLDKAPTTAVTVNIAYSGTAANGSDYTGVAKLTVLAGQKTASFDLQTIDDKLIEGAETLQVKLVSATGGGFSKVSVDTMAASVTTKLIDNDQAAHFSLSGPSSVREGQTAQGYTVSVDQAPASDVTVQLIYGGTALDGVDFQGVAQVVLRAGQTLAKFDLAMLRDRMIEGTENLTVTLGAISGGGYAGVMIEPGAASVTTSLVDTTVNLNAPGISFSTDSNHDGVISGSEIGAANQVNVKIELPANAMIGHVLTVSDGLNEYRHTVDTADLAARAWSLKLERPADGSALEISAQIADDQDNVSPLAHASVAIDTSASEALTLSILEDGDLDGSLTRAELGGANQVSVAILLPDAAQVGDTLILKDGVSTQFHTVSEQDLALREWIGKVAAPREGASLTVTATLKDLYGNESAPGQASVHRPVSTANASLVGSDSIYEGQDGSYRVQLSQALDHDTSFQVRTSDGSAQRVDQYAAGQNIMWGGYFTAGYYNLWGQYVASQVIYTAPMGGNIPNGTYAYQGFSAAWGPNGTTSWDYTLYGENGAVQSGYTTVTIRAGETQSNAFKISAWKETVHVDSGGYTYGYNEGTEYFNLSLSSSDSSIKVTAGTKYVSVYDTTGYQFFSPLAIDLNGDGIQTLAYGESEGTFDLLGDGSQVQSGWLSKQDGFLAVDADGNGQIDSVKELFGGAKGEAAVKLASYDSNGDGVVDKNDARFCELRIWRDADSDKRTDAGELVSLDQAGVASIKVAIAEGLTTDVAGNQHDGIGEVTLASGDKAAMTDVFFNYTPAAQAEVAPVLPTLSLTGPGLSDGLVAKGYKLGLSEIASEDVSIQLLVSDSAGGADREVNVTIPAGKSVVKFNLTATDAAAESIDIRVGDVVGATLSTKSAAVTTFIESHEPSEAVSMGLQLQDLLGGGSIPGLDFLSRSASSTAPIATGTAKAAHGEDPASVQHSVETAVHAAADHAMHDLIRHERHLSEMV